MLSSLIYVISKPFSNIKDDAYYLNARKDIISKIFYKAKEVILPRFQASIYNACTLYIISSLKMSNTTRKLVAIF